ncbi:cysteine desulfurase [Prauserella marina]|uniref:Selenocysteine lyase/Cysteine desulfurase n=1 Tax=Prauserella marina TaxID=530584 RepID=A0A222VQI6_9PSEU|nr:aminotransferase class V-fold PLP-dependent enzyme [Prauserella marina]ASR36112.1 cysteine desulfurase [Prauserella marina]PWV76845.1 selenocysteine lyase/cysteine desulfurase [Prauserella marina]SDC98890.1 Selenocysteine lyase/Cysteine desulfurase [Prauserella marina]
MTSTLNPIADDTIANPIATVPETAGAELTVPLVTGESVGYANFDHAASAPCLSSVRRAVDEFLPWYASVHRGAGFASQVSTTIYERARQAVHTFVGGRSCDSVVFTRNTTDSLNLLARAVPRGTAVVLFDTEHHAALLPWRGHHVRRLPAPRTRSEAVTAVAKALAECPEGPRLVVAAGASNVTGELLPVAELTEVAHEAGARIVVDAAQLAPHRRVSLRELGADYVALSGHKLYAPFGAGALVGRSDWLRAAEPYLAGGGASKLVQGKETGVEVVWNTGAERHEAGSPNTVGVYALGVACTELATQWQQIEDHETALLDRLTSGLAEVAGLRVLRLFAGDGQNDQVGTISFVIDGFQPNWVAAVLSAEYGIGVRDGAFCAHIATRRLIGDAGGSGQQALRVSLGLGSKEEHVERLLRALHDITQGRTCWDYTIRDGRWAPTPDPRPLPTFLS